MTRSLKDDAGTAGLEPIEAPLLAHPRVAHAFFTRQGGVSQGFYATLNGGIGSNDDPVCVGENRRRMAAHLQVDGEIQVPYQIHSATALVIDRPFAADARPRCDALVTATPGLALGVTGADCGMILFFDETAGVIAAAHAGWKGALGGIVEATIVTMESCGATRGAIRAALGPTIGVASYEVGAEFFARFQDHEAAYAKFFAPSKREGHFMFNLPAFIGMRLRQAGIGQYEDIGCDTYADPQRFFSFRRTTHKKEADYGRLVAAIALR